MYRIKITNAPHNQVVEGEDRHGVLFATDDLDFLIAVKNYLNAPPFLRDELNIYLVIQIECEFHGWMDADHNKECPYCVRNKVEFPDGEFPNRNKYYNHEDHQCYLRNRNLPTDNLYSDI
jgi:hypothetical protein